MLSWLSRREATLIFSTGAQLRNFAEACMGLWANAFDRRNKGKGIGEIAK
jgi:hypothetical protein